MGRAIREDMANTELVATFLRFAMSASGMEFDPRTLARELTVRVAEEVDYRREAGSIATFSELYRGHPFIHVPDIVTESGRAVAAPHSMLVVEVFERINKHESLGKQHQPKTRHKIVDDLEVLLRNKA